MFSIPFGILWWYFAVVRPALKFRKTKTAVQAHVLLMHVLWIFAALVSVIVGNELIFTGLLFSPPAVLTLIVVAAYFSSLYAFLGTLLVLLIGGYFIFRTQAGIARIFAFLGISVAVCVVPYAVQSYYSGKQIVAEFVHLEGDCLSTQSLLTSIRTYDDGYANFHAVMIKGHEAYVWSYAVQSYVKLWPENTYRAISHAPDASCSSYEQSLDIK